MIGIAPEARFVRVGALLALLSLFIAGCGFHLRGSYQIPPSLSPIHVVAGQASGLAREIRRSLRISGIAMTEMRSEAKAVIRVLHERFDRRVLSVDGRGKVIEFELRFQADFEVEDSSGNLVVPRGRVRLVRSQINPETSTLGQLEEEQWIREDLYRDAGDRVLQQIRARLG